MTEDQARERIILSMCPQRVCRTCGEPSRRVSQAGSTDVIGSVIREAREAAGLSRAQVGAWFEGGPRSLQDYEEGGHVPPRRRWDQLKAGLGIGDEWDYLIPDPVAVSYVTEDGKVLAQSERRTGGIGYDRGGGPPSTEANRIRATRQAPDRWSDCGHDDWRPGVVLDPFA